MSSSDLLYASCQVATIGSHPDLEINEDGHGPTLSVFTLWGKGMMFVYIEMSFIIMQGLMEAVTKTSVPNLPVWMSWIMYDTYIII